MPPNESASSKSTAADARRPDYNATRTRSNEETEVDKLIQQLSTDETTPAAGEESHQPQPTKLEQKNLQKHGMRHKISKGPGAASMAAAGGAPAFSNAKKEAAVAKNSRKPRNGFGPRGAFKKGGAGGKGVWGRIGDEMMDYEEDMQAEAEDEPSDYDKQQAQKEEITNLDTLRTALTPVLQEYYNHGKSAEVIRFLESTSIKPSLAPMVAYLAVVTALDKKAAEREMTSHLLADMYEALLNEQQFEAAISQLLQDLPDLTLDCPDAVDIVASFTARCVADDCLAPKFLDSSLEKLKGDVVQAAAVKAVEKAIVMINMKHGLVRLDNVWGVAGATRPVKQLIKKMHQILKEYVASSGDVTEALRSLRELEVPHFHHEFVYEAILEVMEDGSDRVFDLVVKLLKVASQELVLTVDQLTTGFHRLYEDLIDIVLDVPNAYTATEKFATQCQEEGIIPVAVLKEFPTRGRKRYVSENDGGKLKEDTVAVEEFRQRVASNAAHIEEEDSDNE